MKIGLFSIGLDTYWGQYEGLLPRLQGYESEIATHIGEMGVEVVRGGMVDNEAKSLAAASLFSREEVELVCIFISTYALSSTVLPLVQRVGKPVLLLNIQPEAAIDYARLNAMGDRVRMTGEWLAHCQACSVPELACVLNRSGLWYDIVTGYMQDPALWKELEEWMAAARAVGGMRSGQLLEMCELRELRDSVTSTELQGKLEEFQTTFRVSPECSERELERAARTSVALDKLVARHRLTSLAYYYEGRPGNEYEDLITSFIAGTTLLTGRGIPVAGECEVKNVQAMSIMALLGAGGSFSEPYAMDFRDNVILWGHDGPGHFNMAEDGIALVPLPVFHGKPGQGLSIQMSVRQGPATLLSVCENEGKVHLLVAEGESVPGETLQIGNTNSRYHFPMDIREFMNRWSKGGPSHHCAIGVGHVASKIEKLAALMKIPVVRIG